MPLSQQHARRSDNTRDTTRAQHATRAQQTTRETMASAAPFTMQRTLDERFGSNMDNVSIGTITSAQSAQSAQSVETAIERIWPSGNDIAAIVRNVAEFSGEVTDGQRLQVAYEYVLPFCKNGKTPSLKDFGNRLVQLARQKNAKTKVLSHPGLPTFGFTATIDMAAAKTSIADKLAQMAAANKAASEKAAKSKAAK